MLTYVTLCSVSLLTSRKIYQNVTPKNNNMDKKAPKQKHRFKKGDAFIELTPDSLIFMEINDVEDSTEKTP